MHEYAAALSVQASRDTFGAKGGTSQAEAGGIAKDLRQCADQLKNAKDLAAARQAFSALPNSLNNWLTASQFQYKTTLAVYQHPASPSGEPELWIQKTGVVLNPYQVKDTSQCRMLRKIEGRGAMQRNP